MLPTTHTVTVYRRDAPASSARGERLGSAWTLLAPDVECHIQPVSGEARQREYGRELPSEWLGFLPSALALSPEHQYGLVVTAGTGLPPRLVSTHVADWSFGSDPDWEIELGLARTLETIP